MRTYAETYESLKKNVLDIYNPDIYIHTWKTYGHSLIGVGEDVHKKRFVVEGFDRDSLEVDIELAKKLLCPVKMVVEDYNDIEAELQKEAEFIDGSRRDWHDSTPSSLISLWRKIYLCNSLIEGEYDLVIRSRPDILFRKELDISDQFNTSIITPLEQSYKVISDILAYSSQKNMNVYSELYKNIRYLQENTNVKMNTHHLLKKWLEVNGISNLQIPIDIKIMKYKDGQPFIYHENARTW